ncbi:MAG: chemotaxis protein CheB, partial [Rhodanobacter sp.]
LTDAAVGAEAFEAAKTIPTASAAVVSAPDAWALVDDNAPGDQPDAASFGIEKVSAADFLAPDVEPVSPDVEPTMSLELVSLEESVAPQAFMPDHEMLLDDLHSALSRVVLLGAGVDAIDSVGVFLAALPVDSRLTFVLTQHLGGRSDEVLLETFAGKCALPVQLADAGRRAKSGEVLMVPAGHQIRLLRDGKVELPVRGEHDAQDPSIDATLTMGASVFGRDALAIVFAGGGNDAVAGAQAIHNRGGQVWVESSSGEHFADMVSGIFAERLVSYSGTPSELAAHLLEVFP